MRVILLVTLFVSFSFFNGLHAQNNLTNSKDTLVFKKLFFYGNSITLNNKHITLRKAKKMLMDVPEAKQHFKHINRIRVAEYPVAFGAGFLTSAGLINILASKNINVFQPVILIGGVGLFVSLIQLDQLEQDEMKSIIKLYNTHLSEVK